MQLSTPASAFGRSCGHAGARGRAPGLTLLAYIQQIPRGAGGRPRRSLQELISYLKKIIYNSNKTFETSLTTIRRYRYDLDKPFKRLRRLEFYSYHNRMTVPENRIPLLCTHSFPKARAGGGGRRVAAAARAANSSKLNHLRWKPVPSVSEARSLGAGRGAGRGGGGR